MRRMGWNNYYAAFTVLFGSPPIKGALRTTIKAHKHFLYSMFMQRYFGSCN